MNLNQVFHRYIHNLDHYTHHHLIKALSAASCIPLELFGLAAKYAIAKFLSPPAFKVSSGLLIQKCLLAVYVWFPDDSVYINFVPAAWAIVLVPEPIIVPVLVSEYSSATLSAAPVFPLPVLVACDQFPLLAAVFIATQDWPPAFIISL